MKYDSGIFFDRLPQEVQEILTASGIQSSDVKVAIRSDLDLAGALIQSWLLISDESIMTVTPHATVDDRIIGPYPLQSVEKVRIFKGVGSSFLQVRIQNFFINIIRFSNARREEFNRARIYLDDIIVKQTACQNFVSQKFSTSSQTYQSFNLSRVEFSFTLIQP